MVYGYSLDNDMTNHVRICACIIVQFAQKHNLSTLFTITFIYKLRSGLNCPGKSRAISDQVTVFLYFMAQLRSCSLRLTQSN